MANHIHPTAILEGEVVMGEGNHIGAYSVLIGPIELGDHNWIGPHVVIGTPGQDSRDPRHDPRGRPIRIGSRNLIREFTVVKKPCYGPLTCIGDDVFLMQAVHVPHDATIEDHVVISPNVAMGGLVTLMEGANLALACNLHQRTVVGSYAICGMGAAVVKDVPPFCKLVPGRPLTVNTYALEKFGLTDHADEVAAWLHHRRPPTTDRIARIVDRFEALHRASGRALYT